MAVWRKRSTTSVPAALSISYLIGSPPIGTSITTLTSSAGGTPSAMASGRRALQIQQGDQPPMRTASMPAAKAKGQRVRAGPPLLAFLGTKSARLAYRIHAACHMLLDRFSRIGSYVDRQRTQFFGLGRKRAEP